MRTLFDLLRRELSTESLISIASTEWEEAVAEFRKFAMNCSESTNREACDERLKDYKETFKDLIKLRIYKMLKTEEVPETSVDEPFLRLVLKLITDFTSSLDEVVADERGRVFVIVRKRLDVGGVIAEPNELVMMSLMEAVALSAFGYVELLKLPVEGSEKFSWITSEPVKA
ncbi:hypothetical protein [Ignicoccus hospitalis]|uniref:hypothetical protein n=1 Tax=Ignicoccus hospitalis TaxID=160233 RepID=UPI000324AB1F|nr:hypothetical protein [Ignicoccus hospitalis]HIH90557.1 hypothetical protein [Desulfurococcaceae archaeon]